MTRKSYTRPALAALAAGAALLLGGCKATDTAGNTSAATAPSKSKPPSAGGGSASAPAAGTTEVDADGVRRVRAEELQAMVEGGRVVIYDTRPRMSYEQEHIKGSLSMPHEDVASREADFPRDKTLVFYCT